MPQSSFNQASFLGGEWSPFAQGRVKDPAYPTAMNVCRNGFPVEEGAWLRRSGTRYAGTTQTGAAGRVMGFAFEQQSPYILEFTNASLRFRGVATQTGGLSVSLPKDFRLVCTNDNQQISNVSSAIPAVVTTASAHGWNTGDQVLFLFGSVTAANQMPLLANRVFNVTKIGATTFSIVDQVTGTSIDGSTLGWNSGIMSLGTVVVARIFQITTPYTAGSWASLRAIQAEATAFFLHPSYAPYSLFASTLPTATTFANFGFNKCSFTDGPYLDPPTDSSTLTPNGTSGSVTLTASAITSINSGAGFKSTDVGRLVRLLSEPAAWASGTGYAAGNTVKFNGQYFACIQASTGNQPDISTAYWAISTTASTWSWATITGVTSTSVVTATINGAALVNTGAMSTWRLGVYSDTTGYPTCGVYYEGRLWLSGAVANRVDASKVNAVSGSANNTIDMTPTAEDGTVADNNAISYIFNASDVNPIYWMIGTGTGIICGTLAGEWLIQASQLSDPITPTSIQAHRVTTYGCSNIEPAHAELTICFVHRFNRKLLEYFSDVFSAKYNAPNLSRNAKHLTLSGIEEVRYQQELVPVLWARCGDGSLVGATYKRATLFSSQGPEFVGWHRHDLGSTRTVESIATSPSADGTLDTLAMVTTDSSGVRHVEIMESLFDVDAEITDGWFVDDAVVPSGGSIALVNGAWQLTLNGLWHLNGKTVSAWVGGMDAGDYLVTNGSIQVTIDADVANPDALSSAYLKSITSTTAYGTLACEIMFSGATLTVPCAVGFTFTSQGQILRPDTIEQTRSPQGHSMGKKRRVAQFGALLEGTQGISFGTDFTKKMRSCQFTTPGGTAYRKTQLFSGVYQGPIEDDWGFDSMLAWQVTRPYPASLVAISGFMETSEK